MAKSVMPNWTPGEPSFGRDGREPHPRRLADREGRRQRLARGVEPQGAGAVGGRHLDATHLRADGGGAGRDGDRRVGDRAVEVDLKPLAHSRLQRVGHPAGRRVAVDRGGRTGRRRDVGQRRGVRRRTRHGHPPARPAAVDDVGAPGRVVHHAVERVPRVAGRSDGRGVVVDAAVVGFAGHRAVGHGDDGRGQARPHGRRRSAAWGPAAAGRAGGAARRSAAATRGLRRRGPSRRRRSDTAAWLLGRPRPRRPGRSPRRDTAVAAHCR